MARILWELCLTSICLVPSQGAELKGLRHQCGERRASMDSEFAHATSFNNIYRIAGALTP